MPHIDPLINSQQKNPAEISIVSTPEIPLPEIILVSEADVMSENAYAYRRIGRAFMGLGIMFTSSKLYETWSNNGNNYSEPGMLGATVAFMAGYAYAVIPPKKDL